MKRLAVVALAVAAGCSEKPKQNDGESLLETYRSECSAARTACERAADSAGMEKGTHGLAEFLDQWAAQAAAKPPADAADRAEAIRARFIELDATLRSARAIADGTQADPSTLEALDAAAKSIRSLAAEARDEVGAVDPAIRDFAARDRQHELSRRLLDSSQDVAGTTLPTCENAARALGNARNALRKYLDSK